MSGKDIFVFSQDESDSNYAKKLKNGYIELVEKVTKIVGEITNSDNLHIQAGDLNGTITGTLGKAKVQTIGAGGWNIQRFHYRTLVHKI